MRPFCCSFITWCLSARLFDFFTPCGKLSYNSLSFNATVNNFCNGTATFFGGRKTGCRPRRAVSHNATFKAFHDHVVAGYVEGHAIEIVLDPLKRPQQTLGDFHEFGFAISNSELREVRHDIVSQNVENGGIATVDFPAAAAGRCP